MGNIFDVILMLVVIWGALYLLTYSTDADEHDMI